MANIREYTSPIDRVQPSESGASAFEIEGRHIGADIDIAGRYLGGAVSQYERTAQQSEDQAAIAASSKAGADFLSTFHQSLNETNANADPNQIEAAQENWRNKTFEPSLDAYVAGATTPKDQEYRQRIADEYRQHFGTLMAADAAGITSQALKENVRATGDSLAQQAGEMGSVDPEFFAKQYRDMFAESVKAHAGSLTSRDVDALNEYRDTQLGRIYASSWKGRMDINPEAAIRDLQAGKADSQFDEATRERLVAYGKINIEHQGVIAKATQAAQEKQWTDEAQAAGTDFYVNHVTRNSDGSLSVDPGALTALQNAARKSNNPKLGTVLREAMEFSDKELNERATRTREAAREARESGGAAVDQKRFGNGFHDLEDNIYADPGNPQRINTEGDITKLYVKGAITHEGLVAAMKDFHERDKPENQIIAKYLATQRGGLGVKLHLQNDPDFANQWTAAEELFKPAVAADIAKGKPIADAIKENAAIFDPLKATQATKLDQDTQGAVNPPPPFTEHSLDAFPTGPKGAQNGIAALDKAPIPDSQKRAIAKRRGWIQ